MSYLQAAFNSVCEKAKEPEGFYVSLVEESQYFGGPEEGGWYGHDSTLVAYQWFATRETADAARAEVEKLAEELTRADLRSHGEHCLRQLEWLEERGLEPDYLPEDDGPSEYRVVVTEGIYEGSRGCRQYS